MVCGWQLLQQCQSRQERCGVVQVVATATAAIPECWDRGGAGCVHHLLFPAGPGAGERERERERDYFYCYNGCSFSIIQIKFLQYRIDVIKIRNMLKI